MSREPDGDGAPGRLATRVDVPGPGPALAPGPGPALVPEPELLSEDGDAPDADEHGTASSSVPLFASLAVRNYRLFAAGSLFSNVGTWMSRVGQDWLVLTQLTDHSATALGVVTGLQFAPIALLSPLAGAFADRYPKRWLLQITQALGMLTGLVLAALVFSGSAQLWHVYVLAAVQGVISAFDNPARQAFASELVPLDLLTNAVGLNSASFNAARLVGPGLAGLSIAAWGVGPSLLLNALSFAGPLVALALLNTAELRPAPPRRGRGAVREGLRYVRRRPDLIVIMTVVFMLGTFGLNFQLSNALMATRVFGLGAEAYGLLGTIMAVGTLGAALLAARRRRPRLRLIVGALGVFAVCEGALALAPTYVTYAIMLIPVGLAALTVMTAANARVQLTTQPSMRGRVMALYMAIFLGGTPLGAPVIGWIGDTVGPRWTLAVGAIATGLTFLAIGGYLVFDRWRAERRGVWLPEVIAEEPDVS